MPSKFKDWIKTLTNLPPLTRSSPDCNCFVCSVSRSKTHKAAKRGRPSTKKQDSNREKTPPPSTSRADKVKEFMSWSPTTRMMASSETIKEQQANKSSGSPMKLPSIGGGPKMPVILSTETINVLQKKAKKAQKRQ